MNIEKIMTRNVIVGTTKDTIYDLANKMKEFDIGFLPIKEDNKIIGVITDRDLVVKMLANQDTENIENYINTNIIHVDKKENIDNVLNTLSKYKIKRVLITDENNIVGVLSLSDIIENCGYNESVSKTIKHIFEIRRNNEERITEVDEFYL